MILHEKYLMLRKVTSCFMIQIYEFFNHWLEPILLFWFKNKGAQLFLIWVVFWILIWKLSHVLHGKIDVSCEKNSDYPNQPILPRQLKSHIAFLMFPILDTNLCLQRSASYSSPICNRPYKPTKMLISWTFLANFLPST